MRLTTLAEIDQYLSGIPFINNWNLNVNLDHRGYTLRISFKSWLFRLLYGNQFRSQLLKKMGSYIPIGIDLTILIDQSLERI